MLPIETICMSSQAQVYRVRGDKPQAANDGKLTQHDRKLKTKNSGLLNSPCQYHRKFSKDGMENMHIKGG